MLDLLTLSTFVNEVFVQFTLDFFKGSVIQVVRMYAMNAG